MWEQRVDGYVVCEKLSIAPNVLPANCASTRNLVVDTSALPTTSFPTNFLASLVSVKKLMSCITTKVVFRANSEQIILSRFKLSK